MVRRHQARNEEFRDYMERDIEERNAEAARPNDDYHRRLANMMTRRFAPERGINTEGMAPTAVPGTIQHRGWGRFTQTPTPYHPILVREFYASMRPEVFQERGLVWVRHVPVIITAAEINDYLGTPVSEAWDLTEEGVPVDDVFTHNVDGLVANLRRDHQVVREPPPTIVSHGDLSPDLAFWSVFMKSSLIPSTHRTYVTMETARLLYSINNNLGVDVGTIIMGQILKTAESPRCHLTFPCLITHFCQIAGVYIAPDGADLVPPTGDVCAKAYNQFCTSHRIPPIPRERGTYRQRARHAYAPEQGQEEEEAQPQAQIPPEPPARRGRQPRQGNVRPNPPAWAAPIIEGIHDIRAEQAAQRAIMDDLRGAHPQTSQAAQSTENVQQGSGRRTFRNFFRRGPRNIIGESSERAHEDGN